MPTNMLLLTAFCLAIYMQSVSASFVMEIRYQYMEIAVRDTDAGIEISFTSSSISVRETISGHRLSPDCGDHRKRCNITYVESDSGELISVLMPAERAVVVGTFSHNTTSEMVEMTGNHTLAIEYCNPVSFSANGLAVTCLNFDEQKLYFLKLGVDGEGESAPTIKDPTTEDKRHEEQLDASYDTSEPVQLQCSSVTSVNVVNGVVMIFYPGFDLPETARTFASDVSCSEYKDISTVGSFLYAHCSDEKTVKVDPCTDDESLRKVYDLFSTGLPIPCTDSSAMAYRTVNNSLSVRMSDQALDFQLPQGNITLSKCDSHHHPLFIILYENGSLFVVDAASNTSQEVASDVCVSTECLKPSLFSHESGDYLTIVTESGDSYVKELRSGAKEVSLPFKPDLRTSYLASRRVAVPSPTATTTDGTPTNDSTTAPAGTDGTPTTDADANGTVPSPSTTGVNTTEPLSSLAILFITIVIFGVIVAAVISIILGVIHYQKIKGNGTCCRTRGTGDEGSGMQLHPVSNSSSMSSPPPEMAVDDGNYQASIVGLEVAASSSAAVVSIRRQREENSPTTPESTAPSSSESAAASSSAASSCESATGAGGSSSATPMSPTSSSHSSSSAIYAEDPGPGAACMPNYGHCGRPMLELHEETRVVAVAETPRAQGTSFVPSVDVPFSPTAFSPEDTADAQRNRFRDNDLCNDALKKASHIEKEHRQ